MNTITETTVRNHIGLTGIFHQAEPVSQARRKGGFRRPLPPPNERVVCPVSTARRDSCRSIGSRLKFDASVYRREGNLGGRYHRPGRVLDCAQNVSCYGLAENERELTEKKAEAYLGHETPQLKAWHSRPPMVKNSPGYPD
jgi:hypothetical protein